MRLIKGKKGTFAFGSISDEVVDSVPGDGFMLGATIKAKKIGNAANCLALLRGERRRPTKSIRDYVTPRKK